jgi:hypothetical protein
MGFRFGRRFGRRGLWRRWESLEHVWDGADDECRRPAVQLSGQLRARGADPQARLSAPLRVGGWYRCTSARPFGE